MTASVESPASAEELAGDKNTVGQRVHEVLHRFPALSPAIVLVLACIVFSLASDRFLRLQNLSLIAQQVSIVGDARGRADPGHPDRGHRPVRRCDYGAVFARHGEDGPHQRLRLA